MTSVLVIFVVVWAVYRTWQIQQNSAPLPVESMTVQVERVIDGDTLLIAGNRRVRLLGVNTPETKHPTLPPQPFGMEATQFTTALVENRIVRLQFDIERFDDYQRLLAFVYVDEVCLNLELVLAGLATAETQYPFRSDMKKKFIAAEKRAQAARIGIWSH